MYELRLRSRPKLRPLAIDDVTYVYIQTALC